MDIETVRNLIIAGLRSDDWRLVERNTQGEFFGPSGHSDQSLIFVPWVDSEDDQIKTLLINPASR